MNFSNSRFGMIIRLAKYFPACEMIVLYNEECAARGKLLGVADQRFEDRRLRILARNIVDRVANCVVIRRLRGYGSGSLLLELFGLGESRRCYLSSLIAGQAQVLADGRAERLVKGVLR